MTAEGPQAGLTHSRSLIVDPSVIVPALPPLLGPLTDMPPVLATACMVGFVEATCIDAPKPFLEEGQKTVGTHVDLSHVAATPMGMRVTAQVKLVAVECRDEKELPAPASTSAPSSIRPGSCRGWRRRRQDERR